MAASPVWLCAALLSGLPLAAQQPPQTGGPVSVRGTVVSAAGGEPLPFSIVALLPAYPQTFTSQRGEFAFPGLAPGTYRLLARQIGYSPLDTVLVLRADTATVLRVALSRLAIQLPAVSAAPACTAPGPPDSAAHPEAAAVFGQVLENARRYKLLTESHPFVFRYERSFSRRDAAGGTRLERIDTIAQSSRGEWTYRPGKVVVWGSGALRHERVAELPALPDFADSAFVGAHCFQLVGRDTIANGTYVRLDFAADSRLRGTDVEGSAYLDSASYQIRFIVVGLSRIDRTLQGVRSLVTTTRFREIVPGIVLFEGLRAVTTYTGRAAGSRVEEQRLLAVQFLRPLAPARDRDHRAPR